MTTPALHLPRGRPAAPRRVLLSAALAAAMLLGLYVLVPQLAGLDDTWRRMRDGDPWWLAAGVAFELASFASYLVVFRAVCDRRGVRLTGREAYDITLAGLAATRLLATAGAGGVALTAWALRRRGLRPRAVAELLATFLVLVYAVYMLALVLVGAGLAAGVLAGPSPPSLTVVPAASAAAVIVVALALSRTPLTLGRGVAHALALTRTGDRRLLGAVGWWAFDLAVLGTAFAAFGSPPSIAVLVLGYFVGMLGNVLPLPGGVGGVEGGMVAAFAGFGVAPGLALVAVLSYRAIAFWLPTLPGVLAYARLRRAAP